MAQFGIAGTINGLCYVVMMFVQSGSALYRLHPSTSTDNKDDDVVVIDDDDDGDKLVLLDKIF